MGCGVRFETLFIDVLPSIIDFLPEFFLGLLFGHAVLLHEALHHGCHVSSLLLKLLKTVQERNYISLEKISRFLAKIWHTATPCE